MTLPFSKSCKNPDVLRLRSSTSNIISPHCFCLLPNFQAYHLKILASESLFPTTMFAIILNGFKIQNLCVCQGLRGTQCRDPGLAIAGGVGTAYLCCGDWRTISFFFLNSFSNWNTRIRIKFFWCVVKNCFAKDKPMRDRAVSISSSKPSGLPSLVLGVVGNNR